MKTTIEQLHDHARRHTRRAVELRKRSAEVQDAENRGSISHEAANAKVLELMRSAAEESRQASNVMNFLRKYEGGIHVLGRGGDCR